MTIHQLEFTTLETHFGRYWYAKIPGFNGRYAIWPDRDTGKILCKNPTLDQSEHPSIDAAKSWCQSDFERRVKELIKYKLPEAIYPDTIPFPEL